jgi:putative SOS response-associated peptidase YedK
MDGQNRTLLGQDISAEFTPGERLPVVRLNSETRQRELVKLHWGLVPSWAKSPAMSGHLTHARAETVASKPAFREAFRHRRCLVAVDSFAIGKRSGKTIQMKDHRPFGIGGIWEWWQWDDQEPVQSCAVITTEANELVRPVNSRMPVIIAEGDYGRWLDPGFFDAEALEQTMQPFAEEGMEVVSAR